MSVLLRRLMMDWIFFTTAVFSSLPDVVFPVVEFDVWVFMVGRFKFNALNPTETKNVDVKNGVSLLQKEIQKKSGFMLQRLIFYSFPHL